MVNKTQIYDFEFVREWKMKKPNWGSFAFWYFLNFLIQIILLLIHKDTVFYFKLMVAVVILFYLIDGKYPYLKKTKVILTKCDVKRGN